MLSPTLDWRLVLIGDGPRRNVLTRMAFQLNVQDRTEFEAGVSDEALKKEYASATMFVLRQQRKAAWKDSVSCCSRQWRAAADYRNRHGGIPEVLDQGSAASLCRRTTRMHLPQPLKGLPPTRRFGGTLCVRQGKGFSGTMSGRNLPTIVFINHWARHLGGAEHSLRDLLEYAAGAAAVTW